MINGSILNLARIGILLMPIWWILGLNVIIFHFISLIMIVWNVMLLKKRRLHHVGINKISIILTAFILIYACSILINASSFETSRVIGSLYNLSYWIMGLFIIASISNINISSDELETFCNSFRIVGLIQGIFCIFAIFLWSKGVYNLDIEAFLYKFIPQTLRFDIIDSTMLLNIIRTDWFLNTNFPRFTGFFLYPTATGVGTSIILCFTVAYYSYKSYNAIHKLIEMIIISLPLIFSLSRTAILAFIISNILVMILKLPKGNKIYLFACNVIFIGICTMLFLYISIEPMVSFILNSREASTGQRQLIYELAIKKVLESPLLGIGMKPYVYGIEVPIGSHSTYIGTLMKTGFIGLFLLTVFLFRVLFVWLNKYNNNVDYKKRYIIKNLGIIIFTLIIWMFTEDIDAPQSVAFFLFLSIGLLLSVKSEN